MRHSLRFALALLLFIGVRLSAQGRAFTPEDYATWKSIGGSDLTNDGKWVIYSIRPGIGEGELVVRSTTGTTEYRQSLGYVSKIRHSRGGGGGFGSSPAVTADSRWVVFMIEPPMDSVEKAWAEKLPAAKQPKASLAIMDLTTGQVTRIPHVKSFKIPKDAGALVAYSPETEPAKPDSNKAPTDTAKSAKKKTKEDGSPMVLRDLATGKETRIEHVTTYQFTDSASHLLYIVSTKNGGPEDGVYAKALPGGSIDGTAAALAAGPGHYQSITLDKAQRQVAFLSDKADFDAAKPNYGLYYGHLDGSPAKQVVAPDAVGSGMMIPSAGSLSFNKGAELLTFWVGRVPLDTLSSDEISEGAVFDLWHYKDPFLQTQQLKGPDYFKNPRYQAVYSPSTDKWVKIGNDTVRQVTISENGKVALAVSIAPYAVQSTWGDQKYDVYLVDPSTDQWKLIKKGMGQTSGWAPDAGASGGSEVVLSPTGKYVLLFENKAWSAYDVATGKTVDLTKKIVGVSFENEADDHPKAKNPHGIAGWAPNDDRVFIRDKWEMWEVDPTGVAKAKTITGGLGRKNHIAFSIRDPNNDDPSLIDLTKTHWLSATDDETKATGIWTLAPGKLPEKVVMVPRSFSVNDKAKNADMYLVTQGTFSDPHELWVGPSITSLTKITNVGAQQAQYRWGTAELVRYKNREGVPLKAILYKPDGFEKGKKYPMVVDIYELESAGLYSSSSPTPASGAGVNVAVFVSKGYLILKPDIVYRDGHPGMSAVSAVTSAVQSLIDSGFVDPKRIGLVGHSWGGYQDAFIPTQTRMFSAIVSGAPVANMSSAYGGIRWQSGLNRSWQYEHHQSRIGSTPWQRPDLYIENSALFHIDKIQTPIMIMHNDQDGAVPWYQGIELYSAMRRMGKEAYFFNYNGQDHGLSKYADILDWDTRQSEFLDHFLLGAPAPDWMVRGILVDRKNREQVPIVRKLLLPSKGEGVSSGGK